MRFFRLSFAVILDRKESDKNMMMTMIMRMMIMRMMSFDETDDGEGGYGI